MNQDNDLPRFDDGTLMAAVFPGGYPVVYLDGDNETLCAQCATNDEAKGNSIPSAFLHYEGDPVYCVDCNAKIESAYGVPGSTKETNGIEGTRVTAYTYEAAVHCEKCATDRFGVNRLGHVPEDACDADGNPIGAVFAYNDHDGAEACGTCGHTLCMTCGTVTERDTKTNACWSCGTDFRTRDQIEEDAAAKAIVVREGSSLRTSEELCDVFVDDVCELLAIERPPADEFCPHNTDDEGEGCPPDCTQTNGAFASELANDYERKLPNKFTVVWNDGYVIYRDLDAAEREAVNAV